jgi:hypothetical protein
MMCAVLLKGIHVCQIVFWEYLKSNKQNSRAIFPYYIFAQQALADHSIEAIYNGIPHFQTLNGKALDFQQIKGFSAYMNWYFLR